MKRLWQFWWMKAILILVTVILLFFGTPIGTSAISFFQKSLAGMGQMTYTNEVSITDIKVKSLSQVKITIESKANTVADRVYTVTLYLDDTQWATTMPVSWEAAQIPGTKKKITFTGLDLADIVEIDAEVTY